MPFTVKRLPVYSFQAYVKKLLNILLHEKIKCSFRKLTRRVVASLVIPEVQLLPRRAGCKREHPRLTYNIIGRCPW
jgi:hypothetical protein